MRAIVLSSWVLSLGLLVACSSDEDDASTNAGGAGATGAQSSATGAAAGGAGGASSAGGAGGTAGSAGSGGGGAAAGQGGLGGAGGQGTGGTGSGGGAGEGEVCAGSVIATCAPGLVCCYPCGIPDCDSLCTVPCMPGDPGCSDGGCLLVP